MDKDSRNLILAFDRDCAVRGLSDGRRAKYLWQLRQLRRILGKPFRKARKQDIIQVVETLIGSGYAKSTQRDFKIALKRFYKFVRNHAGRQGYPNEVEWITTSDKDRTKLPPDQVLTADEVRRIAECATNARDRAMVMALYESGCRVGEFLSLKIKDIAFDEYGAVLLVDGKTGGRRIRVIASAPALVSWLQMHPLKDDPNSPVWVSMATNRRNRPLNYAGFLLMLKELAGRAKITKRVNPHSFRHARATHLANKLTEAQMKELFGWVQASDMASVYVHLSGRDVDHALLALHGIKTEQQQAETFKVTICPRCAEKNDPVAKYCKRCALVLDPELAKDIERRGRLYEEITAEVLEKDPAFARELVQRALKLGLGRKLRELTAYPQNRR